MYFLLRGATSVRATWSHHCSLCYLGEERLPRRPPTRYLGEKMTILEIKILIQRSSFALLTILVCAPKFLIWFHTLSLSNIILFSCTSFRNFCVGVADCPAMSFVFVCLHKNTNQLSWAIDWCGNTKRPPWFCVEPLQSIWPSWSIVGYYYYPGSSFEFTPHHYPLNVFSVRDSWFSVEPLQWIWPSWCQQPGEHWTALSPFSILYLTVKLARLKNTRAAKSISLLVSHLTHSSY